jgi:multidrug efflux system membrane fusion protein
VVALDRADAHPVAGDGKLDVVDNLITADSGTFKLRAMFDNTDNALWPGQFVNVRSAAHVPQAWSCPAAVQRGPDGEYVYRAGRQHGEDAARGRAWRWATARCRSPKA